MNLTPYVVAIACAITLVFLVYVYRRRKQMKPFTPVLPYYAANASKISIEDAVNAFEFEKFVVSRFDKSCFTLFYWQGNKNGDVIQASPVLEFDCVDNGRTISFAVECRWYKDDHAEVRWASHNSIEQYKNYERESGRMVFVVIGKGNKASLPTRVFVVPLSKIARHQETLSTEFLEPYERNQPHRNFLLNRQTMRVG